MTRWMPPLLAMIVGFASIERATATSAAEVLGSSAVIAGALLWLARMIWRVSAERTQVLDAIGGIKDRLSMLEEQFHPIVTQTTVVLGQIQTFSNTVECQMKELSERMEEVNKRCEERLRQGGVSEEDGEDLEAEP